MAKKGAIAAAVIGVGALGLGAVALMRSSDTQKQDADSMFSGMLGGGATGGYSDTTGVITPSGSTTNTPSSSITDTIGGILTDVLQTQPQTQTPIIITPSNNGMDDLIPLINAVDNPSDERSDYKQVYDYSPVSVPYAQTATQKAADADIRAGIDSGEYGIVDISYLDGTKGTNTAVEYSPFNFAPTPKQQDISSYNVGKTGGATANTPAKNTDTGSVDSKPTISSTQSTTQKGTSYSVAESNPVQTALKATSSFVGGIASTVGGFFGNLFGGK